MDSWQKQGAIEFVDGPQRIRGLAGSGKTVVLALKAAYLHVKHPDWTIVVTFNTRSLYQHFRDLIRRFTFDQIDDEPDWSRLIIAHAWGGEGRAGVYSLACREHGITPYDYATASHKFSRRRAFDGACEEFLKNISNGSAKELFDAVLVDEAQDLPVSFFRLIYSVVRTPKRIIWAYDDLQNLGDYVMPSAEELFGRGRDGLPLVQLVNAPRQPRQDIVLPVCYRNTPWALATAHALGFGIYREAGLVQMFDDPGLWTRIGYKVQQGELKLGSPVRLRRRDDSYPAYFTDLLAPDDAVSFRAFESADHQYAEVARQVKVNVTDDELEMSDILIVIPEVLTSRAVAARMVRALQQEDLRAHVVGITSSRDEVFSDDSIAITHIWRAKGNEAPMVYVINSEFCFSGFELSKKRNILFTAVTRSRAWVRIFGVGKTMEWLAAEIAKVRAEDYVSS